MRGVHDGAKGPITGRHTTHGTRTPRRKEKEKGAADVSDGGEKVSVPLWGNASKWRANYMRRSISLCATPPKAVAPVTTTKPPKAVAAVATITKQPNPTKATPLNEAATATLQQQHHQKQNFAEVTTITTIARKVAVATTATEKLLKYQEQKRKRRRLKKVRISAMKVLNNRSGV